MCAIAGEIRPNGGVPCERAHEMQDELRRRGPDQSGIYMSDSAVLVHTRSCTTPPRYATN